MLISGNLRSSGGAAVLLAAANSELEMPRHADVARVIGRIQEFYGTASAETWQLSESLRGVHCLVSRG